MNAIRKPYTILISNIVFLSAIHSTFASCAGQDENKLCIGGGCTNSCDFIHPPSKGWIIYDLFFEWGQFIILLLIIIFVCFGIHNYIQLKRNKDIGDSEFYKQKKNIIKSVFRKVIFLILGFFIVFFVLGFLSRLFGYNIF